MQYTEMNPNNCDLYAGIAGAKLTLDEFDFGQGITLEKTFAHIMAPYLAAFAPAEPGKPHPAPWKAVGGGITFVVPPIAGLLAEAIARLL